MKTIHLLLLLAIVPLTAAPSPHQKSHNDAREMYIYAYPLVLKEITKQAIIKKSPENLNTFFSSSTFPTDTFNKIVRPNVDTLYSFAILDLSKQPMVISVPDTQDRYYLIELIDAWTNVFSSLGKRTTGTLAKDFVIVGPQYRGRLPHSLKKIKAPTNSVVIFLRIQTNGKDDYDFVHTLQRGFAITPLDVYKKSGVTLQTSVMNPGELHREKAPVETIAAMNATEFYTLFAQSLRNNPPPRHDHKMMKKFARIGIKPGLDFIPSKLSTDNLRALDNAIPEAKNAMAHFDTYAAKGWRLTHVNGWRIIKDIGSYGTRYLLRAAVSSVGFGANLPQDALYPTAFTDVQGDPLNGKNNYRLHFDAANLPPVHAFWSVTLYNEKGFLVKNPINRFALGDRDDLAFNPDGSLDFYIQNKAPERSKQSNWLPAPAGNFNLTMRLYWPQKSALEGNWNPPGIEKIK